MYHVLGNDLSLIYTGDFKKYYIKNTEVMVAHNDYTNPSLLWLMTKKTPERSKLFRSHRLVSLSG